MAVLFQTTGLAPPVQATGGLALIITFDRGRLIAPRAEEVSLLWQSGCSVELRDYFYSACTLYLALPQVCVDPKARFGFHGPSRSGIPLPETEFDH